jgi:hypothetical protein
MSDSDGTPLTPPASLPGREPPPDRAWPPPGWRREAETWAAARLAEQGITPTGPFEEFRTRPWGAFLRLPTDRGLVYFKALPPRLGHELRMTVRLADWFPDLVLPVLAADEGRRWMLTPDGGERLHEGLAPGEVEPVWTRVLSSYARLQVDCVSHSEELLAAGLPDRRLRHTAAMFDACMETASGLAERGFHGFTLAEVSAMARLRPALLRAADRLGGFGLPETVQHDDLHDRNVLRKGDSLYIHDWGDACISHPFLGLRESLISVAARLGVSYVDDPPGLRPYREAYLAPWTRYAPLAALTEAEVLARPLSLLSRVLSWELAVANAGATERETTADYPIGLLRELLVTPVPG